MYYCITGEYYQEYNQFEGRWEDVVKQFDTIEAASKWYVEYKLHPDYRNLKVWEAL